MEDSVDHKQESRYPELDILAPDAVGEGLGQAIGAADDLKQGRLVPAGEIAAQALDHARDQEVLGRVDRRADLTWHHAWGAGVAAAGGGLVRFGRTRQGSRVTSEGVNVFRPQDQGRNLEVKVSVGIPRCPISATVEAF